jgi:hypothetical protein
LFIAGVGVTCISFGSFAITAQRPADATAPLGGNAIDLSPAV